MACGFEPLQTDSAMLKIKKEIIEAMKAYCGYIISVTSTGVLHPHAVA